MTLEVLLTKASFVLGSLWKLQINIDAFKNQYSEELVTQAKNGRAFQLLDFLKIEFKKKQIIERVKVRFLEDDYICWLKFRELNNHALKIELWESELVTQEKIFIKIPEILAWAKAAKKVSNQYLWGGTIGPNFDCSGLVQSAFSSEGIWLPRDAYQQEFFCEKVDASIQNCEKLIPGDLLFFGTFKKCTHVGIHIQDGLYWHSSGITNGRNGIGIDGIHSIHKGVVSSYYKSQFRSAGRVICCYDGRRLLI